MAKYLQTLIVTLLSVLTLASCVMEQQPEDEATVEQLILPPPTTVTATVTSPTRISVAWTAVTGATKYYVYERVTMAGTDVLVGSVVHPGVSLARANLAASTEYCYTVRTVDATGVGAGSTLACATTPGAATVPAAPATVTATATASDRIRVDWTAVSTATKYYIYRAVGSPTAAYSLVGSILSPGLTFLNASLTAGTQYCYKVAAENSAGVGPQSAAACDVTFAANLEGYWKLNEGSGTAANDVSGWDRHGVLAGATWNSTDRAPLDNNPFAVDTTGAAASAINIPDRSVWWFTGPSSLVLWAKVATTGTTRIAGKRAGACQAVNWELGQDASGLYLQGTTTLRFGVTLAPNTWAHLAVTFSTSGAVLYVNGAQVASGAFTAGPRSADPMQFGNAGNCGGGAAAVDWIQFYSRTLAAAEIQVLGERPPAPTGLTATAAGATRINTSWNAVTNASKYFLYKGASSGNVTLFQSIRSPTTSYSDGMNSPSTTSYWQVRSVRNGIFSEASTEASATTLPPIATPTGVTATATGTDRIRVDWSGVTGAVKYYVYQSAAGGAYALRGSVLEGSGYSYTAANLTPGVQYCYQVQAEGPDSVSAFSAAACATP